MGDWAVLLLSHLLLNADEVSKIGDFVTEALDKDANVIWGARISEGMKDKVRIMTIIAGVNSPYILGKTDSSRTSAESKAFGRELGIDIL